MLAVTLVAGLICTLEDPAINESSGIAPSRIHKGVFWTHNDSGDTSRLFAFDLSGKLLSTFTLNGADAVDWEDMASARVDGKSYLYIGDVGDNARRRTSLVVYRVEEPKRLRKQASQSGFEKYVLTYPDGKFDCEALIVTPKGDIQLITKDSYGDSAVYQLRKPAKAGTYTLTKLGDLKIDGGSVYACQITGADMSPTGEVVVRTYFTAYYFGSGKSDSWFARPRTTFAIALERQGEAICFDPKSRRAITTSEGSPCRVSEAKLPD